jgi:hypothetical protein
MDDLMRFLADSPIAARVALPTQLVVRRLGLSPEAIGGIVESGAFTPGGEEVCELEVGGQCVARGKIVCRRGKSYFKVAEMGPGGAE